MSQFCDYSELDPVLDSWASRNGVQWIRRDRDWDVRSLWWSLPPPESVQLWLDVPANGQVGIHVCHNTTRGGQEHTEVSAAFTDLEAVLDERYETAQQFAQKLRKDLAPNQ